MDSGESCQCSNPTRHLLAVWPGASYVTSVSLSVNRDHDCTHLICYGKDYT